MKEKKMGLLKALFVLFIAGLIILCLVITYPFWWLFAQVVNLVGVKGIRNIDGKLETPVVFYEHPTTKRMVAFIATMHYAEPEYFSALKWRIESLFGYKILFEGVGELSLEEDQVLAEKEREVAKSFDFVFTGMQKLGEIMSLQYQKEGLGYPPEWVRSDIRRYELIRLFAQQDISLPEKGINIGDLPDDEAMQICFKWSINKVFGNFIPVAILASVFTFFSKKKKMVMRLILDKRNEKAVQGINEYLVEGNVATIWGAAHLAGIEKELKRAGFREVSREWFTAYNVRKLSLIECLKKMISAIKAKGA